MQDFDMGRFLAHEYDPIKAKAYYERTKKLKGRKKGRALPTTGGRQPSRALANVPKAPVKKAAPASKRMAELRARLSRLEQVLDDMTARVEAAKARSGIASPTKKAADVKKSAESTSKGSSDKTSAQKKADNKAARDRYEKNKKPETSKQAQSVQDEIEEVQKKIAEARQELQAALAKLRTSSSKPKPKTGPSFTAGSSRNTEGDRQNGA